MMKIYALMAAAWLGSMAMAEAPAPGKLDANSSLDQVLDALHARGQGLRDFAADVSMTETDALAGDRSMLSGKVWYQQLGAGDGRIRVLFDSKKVGNRVVKNFKQEYLLDKGWLIDRDYSRKLQVNRQVLKPGQKINLLKLGEGPFPLPIGQSREDVLRMFEASKIEAAKEDPAGSVHVLLKPRSGTQFGASSGASTSGWIRRRTSPYGSRRTTSGRRVSPPRI